MASGVYGIWALGFTGVKVSGGDLEVERFRI